MSGYREDSNLSIPVSLESLSDSLTEVLAEYEEEVHAATEEGLDEAEKILIRRMKDASPVDSGKFHRSWKGTKRKYKMTRFVGNTKTVRSKGRNIPLSNIFEYSTTNHARPFIKQTFERCSEELVRAIVGAIER
jgi:hypothetical protein